MSRVPLLLRRVNKPLARGSRILLLLQARRRLLHQLLIHRVLLLAPVSRDPPLWLKSHLRLLIARRGRVLRRLLMSRMLRLLLQISKPLVKRGLLLLEASKVSLLLLRVSKPLARRDQLLLQLLANRAPLLLRDSKPLVKPVLHPLLHRVKPLLQLGRRVPILLRVPSKGLLQLTSRAWSRLP